MVAWLVVCQAPEAPQAQDAAPVEEGEPPAQAAPQEAPPEAVQAPSGVHVDPGWAKEGAFAGFALSAVPFGLGVASVVAMWAGNQTAQDWLQVAAGVSAPLVALVPTFGSRSASLANDELTRRPRIFRIIGWVMTIYGAVGLISSFAVGRLWGWIGQEANFNWGTITGGNRNVENTAMVVGRVVNTFTTMFSVLVSVAGIWFISASSNIMHTRATEPQFMPSVAVMPMPGGGMAMSALLTGRF